MRQEMCPEVGTAEALLRKSSEKYYYLNIPSGFAHTLLRGLQSEQQRNDLVRSTSPTTTQRPDNLTTVLYGRIQKAVESTSLNNESVSVSMNSREYNLSLATIQLEAQLHGEDNNQDTIANLQAAFRTAKTNRRKEHWQWKKEYNLPISVPHAENLSVFLTEMINLEQADFTAYYADEGLPFNSSFTRPLLRLHTAIQKTPFPTNREPVDVHILWDDDDMDVVGKKILENAQLVDVSRSNGPTIRQQFSALEAYINLYKLRQEQGGAELHFFPDIEVEAEKRRYTKAVTQPTQTPSFPWQNQ